MSTPFGAKSPAHLLEQLAEIAKIAERSAAQELSRPLVTVFLSSGLQVEGQVSSIQAWDTEDRTVVLDVNIDLHNMRTCYVRVSRIDAVSLHDPSILTFGGAMPGTAPGTLELVRMVQENLGAVIGLPRVVLAADLLDQDRLAIKRALSNIVAAFETLLQLPDARIAVGRLSEIQIATETDAERLSVTSTTSALCVHVPVNRWADVSSETIRTQIEAAL